MTAWKVSADHEEFREAVEFFRSRVTITADAARALEADALQRSFWIGGGLQLSQVQRVFDEIAGALESGEPFEDFRKRVKKDLRNDAHAEVVFRNAVQRSYNAGRYRQMREPSVLKFRPFWMHDSVLDGGTTVQCRTLDGKIFPADHPHWKGHWPPGHHKCRRSIRSLRRSEAERRGIATEEPDVEVPAGWGLLPDDQPVWKPDPATHDKALREALDAKAELAPAEAATRVLPEPITKPELRDASKRYSAAAKAAGPWLTSHTHLGVLEDYTGGAYRRINGALRDPSTVDPAKLDQAIREGKALAQLLTDARAAGHTFAGTVQRGEYLDDLPDKIRERYEKIAVGEEFHVAGFVSTTVSGKRARNFANGLILRFRQRSGVAVAQASLLKSEQEVLLPPGLRFRLVGRSAEGPNMVLDFEEL